MLESPNRLPSKPELNPKEHCNCIVLRNDKQLEGPKDARLEGETENGQDESVTTLSSKDEPQKKNESEKPKESKAASSKPFYVPFYHSHKVC